MDKKNKIKSILQQGKIYAGQGLLQEALSEYRKAEKLIVQDQQIPNRSKLLGMISARIASLQKDDEALSKSDNRSELDPEVQDLIKRLFTFPESQNSHIRALESAVNLAKFGQHKRALAEFNELLKIDSLRVSAAKNIIRCHLGQSAVDDAIMQFQQWQFGDLFSESQLQKVRLFLEGILERKGLSLKEMPISESLILDLDMSSEEEEDEIIDISAVGIKLASGSFQDEEIEFDVNFQSGNVISVLIANKEKALIDYFNVGLQLKDVTFYSPVAIFKGTGVVKVKTQINSGPKRGDYNLDIKIESV